jgi:hypothetical protein
MNLDFMYRAINDGVKDIVKKWSLLRNTETFTLTAGNGILVLSTDLRPLKIEKLSQTSWPYPVTFVPYQKMNEFKQQLTNDFVHWPNSTYTTQPGYWTFYPTASSNTSQDIYSPGAYIEIQDQRNVAGGETITVDYTYMPKKYGRAGSTLDIIDIGEEYERAIILYVSFRMAFRYKKELMPTYKKLYDEEIMELRKFRSNFQHSETITTDFIKF